MVTAVVSVGVIFLGASTANAQIELPEPSGPYISGVSDFEFLNTSYPSSRASDGDGRRIMARVWYPACLGQDFSADKRLCGDNVTFGRRRLYFEKGEKENIAQPYVEAFQSIYPVFGPILDEFQSTLTYSYLNATVIDGPLPVVVFSPGALGYVSQNTALIEEFASHGYAVFSVTHPGSCAGVQYPNGDAVRYDDEFFEALFSFSGDNGLVSDDISTRYEAQLQYLEEETGIVPFHVR